MISNLRIHRIAIPAFMALLVVAFQNCEVKVAVADECTGAHASSDACLDISASGAVLDFAPVRNLSDLYYEKQVGLVGPGGISSSSAAIWFNHTERSIRVQSSVVWGYRGPSPLDSVPSMLPPPAGDCERSYGAAEYSELTSALRAARIVRNEGPVVSDGSDANLTLRSTTGREARLPFIGTGFTSTASRGISDRYGDLHAILESYARQCVVYVTY